MRPRSQARISESRWAARPTWPSRRQTSLLRSEPTLVMAALEVSRRTISKISQTCSGHALITSSASHWRRLASWSPALAGAAMALSSISVVANSLAGTLRAMNIRDASERCGLPSKTLRYYESIELVVPSRSENGYRDYCDDDVAQLNCAPRTRPGVLHRRLPLTTRTVGRHQPRQRGRPRHRQQTPGCR